LLLTIGEAHDLGLPVATHDFSVVRWNADIHTSLNFWIKGYNLAVFSLEYFDLASLSDGFRRWHNVG